MASQLKMERVKRDLTQRALAALTLNQIDQPRISVLERGVRPQPEEAKTLSQALGVPLVELWPDLVEVGC